MTHRTTSVATPVAHLVGPGKLKVHNGRLAFSTGTGTPLRLDPAVLKTVLCYGPVGISDDAFLLLFEHDVQVAWLTPGGSKCRGRLVRSRPEGTALRTLQHRALADPHRRLELARQIVLDKLDSQRRAARHYQKQGTAPPPSALRHLRQAEQRARVAASLDVLRGVEGAASAAWYALFGSLLRAPWEFTRRTRRPPTDPVNALLSLGYTWLATRTQARCEAMGLEVALGALHEFRHGRPSAACDLMEPLRVPAVDRWVVALCNQGLVAPDQFRSLPQRGVRLQPDVFPRILSLWEEHWHTAHIDQALDRSLRRFIDALRSDGKQPGGQAVS